MNPFTKDPNIPLISPPEIGDVLVERKNDIHLGLDIYLPPNTEVVIPPSEFTGSSPQSEFRVVKIEKAFTGPNSIPPTPWWNETQSVIFQDSADYFFIFGELVTDLKVGDVLRAGDVVGRVLPVLKEYRGIPTCMLHIEKFFPNYEQLLNEFGFNLCSIVLEHNNSDKFVMHGAEYLTRATRTKHLTSIERSRFYGCTALCISDAVANHGTHLLQDEMAKSLKPGALYEVKKDLKTLDFSYFKAETIPRALRMKGKRLIFLEREEIIAKNLRSFASKEYESAKLTFIDTDTLMPLSLTGTFRYAFFLEEIG
jgi:hypothetical protein